MQGTDILKIVVEVPPGVRDLKEIREKILDILGIDTVVYDSRWEQE